MRSKFLKVCGDRRWKQNLGRSLRRKTRAAMQSNGEVCDNSSFTRTRNADSRTGPYKNPVSPVNHPRHRRWRRCIKKQRRKLRRKQRCWLVDGWLDCRCAVCTIDKGGQKFETVVSAVVANGCLGDPISTHKQPNRTLHILRLLCTFGWQQLMKDCEQHSGSLINNEKSHKIHISTP